MIIGISGKMRSGKDFTYQIIAGHDWGRPVVRMAFGDGVKEEVFEYILKPLGICQTLEESLSEELRAAHRELWQFWGTTVRRGRSSLTLEERAQKLAEIIEHIRPANQLRGSYWADPVGWCTKLLEPIKARDNYWTEYLAAKYFTLDAHELIVVVTDVRFADEFNMINDLDGYVVRINRPLEDGMEYSDHVSETELDNIPEKGWHWIIENRGTVEDLVETVVNMMLYLLTMSKEGLRQSSSCFAIPGRNYGV